MALRIQSVGLYWRIFLMLLVAQIAIAGGAAGLTVLMQRVIGAPSADWHRLSTEAAQAYRDGGADRFVTWRQPLFKDGIMAFLVDEHGQSVDGGRRRRGWYPAGGHADRDRDRRDRADRPGHVGSDTLAAAADHRPSPGHQQRSVAAGEFSKRVGVGALSRKDEIGKLAEDFDSMAERIEQQFDAQRQLLRDVSHELKSPLARLKLAIELARDEGSASTGTDRWMARLDKEAQALETMLDRILDLARAESGMQDQRRAAFDLDALLQSLIKDASFEALKKGMTVHYVSMAPAQVVGIHSMLVSAIENVIRNAIRYGDADSQITVSLAARGGQAQISVANKGPNLRASDLARIFDPFYRVPVERNGEASGQGIGLTITQKVMLAHDGGVSAENRPDGGLIVRMTLPLATDPN